MTSPRRGPSRVLRLGFKLPVWMYRAHLGFLFLGRVIAVVHRGRKSGARYISGLEVIDRRGGELFVFSAWGARASWYRNIAANGIEELWDGRRRSDRASFRVVTTDEAISVLETYETRNPRAAKLFLPRLLPGYDSSDEARRTLARSGVILAFSIETKVGPSGG